MCEGQLSETFGIYNFTKQEQLYTNMKFHTIIQILMSGHWNHGDFQHSGY
jgi:hypothetical protein